MPTIHLQVQAHGRRRILGEFLLCLQHHRDYDNFRFAIHPTTHKIFSFHPATVKLQNVELKAPWDRQDMFYPPPHPTFLRMHYVTSISKAMKGGEDDCELDDDEEKELSELGEVQDEKNEEVKIWVDAGLSSGPSGREIKSSLDSTVENKGNVETLADMQGVATV